MHLFISVHRESRESVNTRENKWKYTIDERVQRAEIISWSSSKTSRKNFVDRLRTVVSIMSEVAVKKQNFLRYPWNLPIASSTEVSILNCYWLEPAKLLNKTAH